MPSHITAHKGGKGGEPKKIMISECVLIETPVHLIGYWDGFDVMLIKTEMASTCFIFDFLDFNFFCR